MCAAVGAGRAQSAPKAPDAGPEPSRALATPTERAYYHLHAFKAAAQEADPSIKVFWKGVPEDDGNIAFVIYAQRA